MDTVEKMKQIMAEKGMTEQQLAEAIGVSKGAMHNWMKGVGRPSANAVQKVAAYCAGGADEAAAADDNVAADKAAADKAAADKAAAGAGKAEAGKSAE